MLRRTLPLAGALAAALAFAPSAHAACPTAYPTPTPESANVNLAVQGGLCETVLESGRASLDYTVTIGGTPFTRHLRDTLNYRAIRPRSNVEPKDEFKAIPNARPAVLFVHGGLWSAGTRDDLAAYAKVFARRGFVGVLPSYALLDSPSDLAYNVNQTTLDIAQAAQSGQRDIQTTVRNLKARSATLGIDPNKIYVVGHSAGGISALRVATRPFDTGNANADGNQAFRDRLNNGALAATGQASQTSKVDGVIGIEAIECFSYANGFPSTVTVSGASFRTGYSATNPCIPAPATSDVAPFRFIQGYNDIVIQQNWAVNACASYPTKCKGVSMYFPFPNSEVLSQTGTHSDGSTGRCVFGQAADIAASSSTAPGGDHLFLDPRYCVARAGILSDGSEATGFGIQTTSAYEKSTVANRILQQLKAFMVD